ncbi:hypothetical protein N7G274_002488 [Stereocaulon virgatum]|uniref:Nephrocystin 3-like N-terminal domain-containing protein n=1 Tax=Stereocaulon virgatum TaxID=373712 RepID=A0ABR4AFX4_9LECA
MDATVRRIGITVLYEPEDEGSHEVDIVLVHGLFGHPKNTWTYDLPRGWLGGRSSNTPYTTDMNDESEERAHKKPRTSHKETSREVFWPQDLLPQTFPQARILAWGYDVQVEELLSSSSQASIFHHAETLLSDLVARRNSVSDKEKPIIFIAHSLGGIVVKDALSLSNNEKTFISEILPATTGVVFMGTPHHGSKIASLGKIAFELSKVFLQKPNLKILRGIEVNSEVLERISRSFSQVLAAGQLKVHSFREELDTKGVRIVEDFSSTIGYLNETRGSLHANHRDMAKFSSAADVKFQRVVSVLRRWIQEGNKLQSTADTAPNLSPATPSLPNSLVLEQRYHECLESLNSAEARNRVQAVEVAYVETYNWLFDRKLGLCDWLEGRTPNSIFWIQGKPGSGKSTVMKHLMNHHKTRELLGTYHGSPWLVAGYFFHDRGTLIQKSVKGFLGEILYQILRQRKELFPSMYTVFSRLYEICDALDPVKGTNRRASINDWSIGSLQEALISVGSKANYDVNVCLFVDALDEHDGNHRELLSTLSRLSQLPENPFFRLRLCLAGRPENIFKDAFHTCPGFPIHQYTTGDIRLYAHGRIQREVSSSFTSAGENGLQDLIEDIIEKAHGVFLWVRLVVDELIEGLCEGDSIDEIKDLLSTIPAELEDLYERAIRRISRTSSSASKNQKYEAYVMFKIAVCAKHPLPLMHFLAVASFSTTGKHTDLQGLPMDQMKRRLNGRSAGLLDTTGFEREVQFIHQTVKDFMTNGSGFTVACECLGDKSHDNGHLLILRYILSRFENAWEPSYRHMYWASANFGHSAYIVEMQQGIEVNGLLENAILRLPNPQQLAFFDYILLVTSKRWIHNNRKLRLFVFYTVHNLDMSRAHLLKENQSDIVEDICSCLLDCASSAKDPRELLVSYLRSDDFELFDELVRYAISRRNIGLSDRETALREWDQVRVWKHRRSAGRLHRTLGWV